MAGIVYGVGVGPGNPELMTLMSVRVIRESDVIFLPVADKEKCHAFVTAREAVKEIEQKEIIGMDFPMTRDENVLQKAYETIACKMQEKLEEGKNISFLTIGDVTIYSTFCYVAEILKNKGYIVEFINGVPSFAAVCATLGIPMAEQEEEIHIIPASYEIEESFLLNGTKVYMKSGRKLSELISKLKLLEQTRSISVYGIANCSMENQKIAYSLEELEALEGYLVTIILKDNK